MMERLDTPSGSSLAVHVWDCPQPLRIVHVSHGLAEHAARYERFGRRLAEAGCAVFAHDHRGHGQTRAPGAPLGQFGPGGLGAVLDDMAAVRALARSRHPGIPLVAFGHSLGAILTLCSALASPTGADAIAVWNTSVDRSALAAAGRLLLLGERWLKGSDVPSTLGPRLTFEAWNGRFAPTRTEADWLSRDAAEVDAYLADPLCGFPPSVGLWLTILDAIASITDSRLARLPPALPVHLAAGGQDTSNDGGRAMQRLAERLRRAGLRDVTVRLWPDSRHEGLNDLDRDAITADFLRWIETRTDRTPTLTTR